MEAMIAGLLLWFFLAVAVGVYAGRRGRSGLLYFLLSILLSPLIGFLIAAMLCGEEPAPAEPLVPTGNGPVIVAGVTVLVLLFLFFFFTNRPAAPIATAPPPTAPVPATIPPEMIPPAPAPEPSPPPAQTRAVAPLSVEPLDRPRFPVTDGPDPKFRLRVKIVAPGGVAAFQLRADGAFLTDKKLGNGQQTWVNANSNVQIISGDWPRLRVFSNGFEMSVPHGGGLQALAIALPPDTTPISNAPPPDHQ